MSYRLIIGNKAYSSWSLRPWILMRTFGIAFEEILVPLYEGDYKEKLLALAPNGLAPALHDDGLVIWDTLAIAEYLAERHPDLAIWPRDAKARAVARSISAEMHSGFSHLRNVCSMNVRRTIARKVLPPEVVADVARIEQAWADARTRFGGGGPFLFGAFSAADAMFAPVVSRFERYDVEVTPATRAYMEAVMALPAWQQWHADAAREPWHNAGYDAL